MVGYAKLRGRRYEKVETTLTERYYSDRELRTALRAAGFDRIHAAPWSPWSDQHTQPAIDRNLWTARVPRAESVRRRGR
jgi:hypothetical protein